MAFLSFLLTGSCSYEEDLNLSPVGLVSFTYDSPYLFVIDAGVDFPTAGVGTIRIYDVSNPFGPTLLSTTNTPAFTGPRFPRVDGNYLYLPYSRPNTPAQATSVGLTGQTPGLSIWDVSNKSNPSQVGFVGFDYSAASGKYARPRGGVAVIGSSAFVPLPGTADEIIKVDISTPSSPTITSTYKYDATQNNPLWIEAMGDHLITCGSRGTQGYVLSTTTNPFPSSGGSIVTPTQAVGGINEAINRVGVNEVTGMIYGPIQPADDILTVDATNLSSLSEASRVDGPENWSIAAPVVVIDDVDRVYAGATNIIIWDVSTPSTPSLAGTITSPSSPTDMCRITDGCPGFIWSEFTGSTIHLTGTAPTS